MTDDSLWIGESDDLAARPAARPRKHKSGAFIKVPLWWAEQMTQATGTAKAFVGLWLLYLAWKAKSSTVTLTSQQLKAHGVGRDAKCRALNELEAAGLIKVSRRKNKNPIVTLLGL
jgi:hypothetical protein